MRRSPVVNERHCHTAPPISNVHCLTLQRIVDPLYGVTLVSRKFKIVAFCFEKRILFLVSGTQMTFELSFMVTRTMALKVIYMYKVHYCQIGGAEKGSDDFVTIAVSQRGLSDHS